MLNPELTIVINTFNSDEKIYKCLNSINQEFKVLIIENSDNIEFKDRIEKKYSNVNCELTGQNLGYAKGNNLGLSKVTSKYALILNPDAILSDDALENFLKRVKNFDNFALIGPLVQEKKDLIKRNEIHSNHNLIEVETIKGFAMFLNVKHFEEIGFFDENFFIYFEEIDLCKRLKEIGKNIFLDPKIIIDHIGGSSHNSSINFEMELSRNWHWMWSTFYFHKKHKGFIFALMKISGKYISALFKTCFYLLSLNTNKRKIYFQRLSGLYNSIIGKKSWYRPKISKY